MAGSSLFMLIDDIASVLDDVALMTKLAAKKTAGVLGDDLALNAQQLAGVNADRELPVVFAVARGSALNKAILVPAALAISALLPWAVIPLLMLGGAYLCYEGFEKLAHKFLHTKAEDAAHHAELVQALAAPEVDLVAFERDKIKGAVRTDFILSAEIIVISLGTVADAGLAQQFLVLAVVSVAMTLGVYGLVAGIVKLDDAGLHLSAKADSVRRAIGRSLLAASPYLMKTLSVVGTAAMFMVGGGILVHGVPLLHHAVESAAVTAAGVPGIGAVLGVTTVVFLNAAAGVIAGGLVLLGVTGVQRIWRFVRGGLQARRANA